MLVAVETRSYLSLISIFHLAMYNFRLCGNFCFRGISNDEKVHLRQKLLLHLREENYQVFPETFDYDVFVGFRIAFRLCFVVEWKLLDLMEYVMVLT